MMPRHLPAALGLAALAAACAAPPPSPPPPAAAAAPPPPQPVVVADTAEAVYSVRAIDRRRREITLNTPRDTTVTIKAGPQVRNFDRIRIGDRVRVRFADAVALAMAPPGTPPGPEAMVLAERGPRGQRPQRAVGAGVTETVRIVSVDPATGRTTFVRPDGTTRTVTPQRPEVVAFARSLRPGDMVSVTFAEAVAVEVEPAI